jgi:hypothetical protein
MKALVNKSRLDVSKIFLCFVATVGDVERTALACDVDPEVVRALALSEDWNLKVKRLRLASKGSGEAQDEFARMQNRALNWVIGHRIRDVLDRVVMRLSEQSDDELIAGLTETNKDGSTKMNARCLSDLTKALETAQGMTYAALADTIPERKASTGGAGQATADLHSALVAALNGGLAKRTPSDILVTEATQRALSDAPVIDVDPTP